MIVITIMYLLVNVAYFAVVPREELKKRRKGCCVSLLFRSITYRRAKLMITLEIQGIVL